MIIISRASGCCRDTGLVSEELRHTVVLPLTALQAPVPPLVAGQAVAQRGAGRLVEGHETLGGL